MTLDSEQLLPVVSLFCGAGGLDTGFLHAGFKPIIALDCSGAACETYKYNYPSTHVIRRNLALLPKGYILERLSELPSPLRPVGVIGGPPCQAFSLSNGHKRPNDPRARLSEHYASLLAELNEEYELDFFVFENVPGLLHEEHDAQFRNIKDLLASAGFWILEGELDAQDFRGWLKGDEGYLSLVSIRRNTPSSSLSSLKAILFTPKPCAEHSRALA